MSKGVERPHLPTRQDYNSRPGRVGARADWKFHLGHRQPRYHGDGETLTNGLGTSTPESQSQSLADHFFRPIRALLCKAVMAASCRLLARPR